MAYAIEKNVPLPTKGQKLGITSALRSMSVGDSVLFPDRKTASELGTFFANLKPMKFTTRKTPEGGLRVWRIE